MSAYTQGDITVETGFPILDIGKFKMNIQPGDHSHNGVNQREGYITALEESAKRQGKKLI